MKHKILGVVSLLFAIGSAISVGSEPALAHHSFALFDPTKVSTIEGTVNKFEWSNPHCWLFVDVPAANGPATTYGFELRSVGELLRAGWKKRSVRPGDRVKVTFRPVRDGSPAGQLMQAWTADGQLIGKPIPAASGNNSVAVPVHPSGS